MTYAEVDAIAERIGGISAAQRDSVTRALTSACAAIDAWCGQSFSADTVASARLYRPSCPEHAWVDPFYTTTGLVIATDESDAGTYGTTWTSSEYELVQFGGSRGPSMSAPYDTIRAIGRVFPTTGYRRITLSVTAKWGWAAVPQAVVEATHLIAADLWKRKDAPLGIATGSVDFGGLRVPRDVMAQAASLLEHLRRYDRVAGIG